MQNSFLATFTYQVDIFSRYSSSFFRLINLCVPLNITNWQFGSFVFSLNEFIPILNNSAASGNVRFIFSHIGISILLKSNHLNQIIDNYYMYYSVVLVLPNPPFLSSPLLKLSLSANRNGRKIN